MYRKKEKPQMRGHYESHDERHCGPRHRRGHSHGYGHGGRHGQGGMGDMGPDDIRAGRMLAQGDLRLIALALIAEAPRHGYEIIKLVEEKTGDWYSPSPGTVYPTLTYLEEAGYVTASTAGNKRLYTITHEGRAYLAANRHLADAVLARLTALSERAARMRRRLGDEEAARRNDDTLPRSINGAFQDLSEAVRDLLKEDREAKGRIIDAIDRLANELRRK
jgi:DNA-binding PadR family transcriptional regulator